MDEQTPMTHTVPETIELRKQAARKWMMVLVTASYCAGGLYMILFVPDGRTEALVGLGTLAGSIAGFYFSSKQGE